jgi:hypothetical protein
LPATDDDNDVWADRYTVDDDDAVFITCSDDLMMMLWLILPHFISLFMHDFYSFYHLSQRSIHIF